MNTNLFAVFILSLTTAITYFYAEVREHYNPTSKLAKKVDLLEQKIKEERFRHLITSYEFSDFRNHVATLIPNAINDAGGDKPQNLEKTYPLRSLASVVQKRSNESLHVMRANQVFETGKKHFREQKHEEAIKTFKALISTYPYSVHVPEALFLLIESHFVARDYDQCVHYANKMLDLYPDLELTGYALLRLGKVYEVKERYQDAIEIYKTVLKSFSNRGIASLAETSLREVEL